MIENVDYSQIDVPEEKDPKEYTCHEKRAEIFRKWRDSNDPSGELSQTELSKRYGNAVSTIHNDFEVVREFIRENIGEGDEIKSDLGFDRSIRNLEQQGKWYKAAQVRKMKWEWLQDSGYKDKQPDELNVNAEVQYEHLVGAATDYGNESDLVDNSPDESE